ncbi:hypothetical protein GETHLI_12940 [Geothrix limicola]|uniref:Lipoprotein n=1 Tax=Geothrix limicola TaxID=2927978 RepID=A0ABQ5QDQ0_9BACT|nr:hypothetical protein [Geothrix limicola]GLH72792.1 hypothetical protein GETHLI_12940 [Geothrix limicola]
MASLPALLLVTPLACKREDPQIRALTEQASQADEAAQLLRQAWSAQFRRLDLARIKGLTPGTELMLLTAEQKQALEARVRAEKDNSRRGLLREILDKDVELRALNDHLTGLRAALPEPEIVRPNDSHYGLALRFLKGQGLSEDDARRALNHVPISERLVPGFEVYHFYVHGQYGTWVSQGRAWISPRELAHQDPDLASERDQAVATGRRLQKELSQLEGQRRQIEAEIRAIQEERRAFLEGRNQLQSENAQQAARLNSLHYLVGVRDRLETEGIIEVPFIGKDHSGPNWRDAVFTQHLDLRAGTTLVIQARDLGLKQISQVSLVPGSYVAGEHYRLTLSADRQTATVELLAPPRFKNDKVVFAVVE